jgi:hypothetical protein
MMDIAKVLQKIRPNSVWSLDANDFEKLFWKDESTKPSYEEIVEGWEELRFEIEIEKIKEFRKAAYKEESDPLFFEYQRGDIEKDVWLSKIQEIKERYPFPASSQQ